MSTPTLNSENLLKEEPAEIKKFEENLALHMKNIMLLDFINSGVNTCDFSREMKRRA